MNLIESGLSSCLLFHMKTLRFQKLIRRRLVGFFFFFFTAFKFDLLFSFSFTALKFVRKNPDFSVWPTSKIWLGNMSCTHDHNCEDHECSSDWSLYKHIDLSKVSLFLFFYNPFLLI